MRDYRYSRITRRSLLRGAGVAMSLPLLDIMLPSRRAHSTEASQPRRMIAICNNLGLLPDRFFPSGQGRNYALSPYLQQLKTFRDNFTVLSGVSHPGVDGSHSSDVSFLTAAPHPGSGGFRNTISLDQLIATRIGHLTRFPSLTLGVNVMQGSRSLSFTGGGALIPCEESAAAVYRKLFLQGSKQEVERQIQKLKLGQSIMDTLGEQSQSLRQRLGAEDRNRIDQYTDSVREVERRMSAAEQWERQPKPERISELPVDPEDSTQYMEKTRLMYEMAMLACETDSTRAITILLDSTNSPTIEVDGFDITDGYHNLSHHGQSEKKLSQLDAIDRQHMQLLGELLSGLSNRSEGGKQLLDSTMVLYGSNFGDANKHTTDNMPILLAGGEFRHGQHLAFDRDNNYPLPNLFVSMLQQMQLEVEQFASSSGTMTGLET